MQKPRFISKGNIAISLLISISLTVNLPDMLNINLEKRPTRPEVFKERKKHKPRRRQKAKFQCNQKQPKKQFMTTKIQQVAFVNTSLT